MPVIDTLISVRDKLYSTVESVRPKIIVKRPLPKPMLLEKVRTKVGKIRTGGKLFGTQEYGVLEVTRKRKLHL